MHGCLASDMEITLQRKNRVATAYLRTLVYHPEENIFVQPNDVLYFRRSQKKFVAAGAIGATSGTTESPTQPLVPQTSLRR